MREKDYSRRRYLLIGLTLALFCGLVALGSLGCSPGSADRTGGEGSGSGTAAEAGSGGAGAGGSDEALGAAFTWTAQSDCATCHTGEASDTSDAKHVQAVAHKALACVNCHNEEAVLQTAHEGVTLSDKPATKPSVITVGEQACRGCHGELTTVAERTATSLALTDDQGLVVNPHQRPEGPTHSENPATCTSCHNNHSETLARDAKKYCASCHHRGVWQCGTCHEQRS